MLRLLLDGDGLSLLVKLHNAEALRVVHIVAEYRGPLLLGRGSPQQAVQAMAVENVVPQHHGDGVISDKLFSDDKGLGQSVGAWLNGIA